MSKFKAPVDMDPFIHHHNPAGRQVKPLYTREPSAPRLPVSNAQAQVHPGPGRPSSATSSSSTSSTCTLPAPTSASSSTPPALPSSRGGSPRQIHNLVGTARLDLGESTLFLPAVCAVMPNASFDKQKFAAITIRLNDPTCTILLFSSGKMVLTGCKTYLQCVNAAHQIAAMLKTHFPYDRISLLDVTIQNIVANTDLGLGPDQHIDLDAMMEDNNVHCTYLKHMFPGLIFRPRASPVVLLIFLSGKVVITGGRSCHDVECGWQTLWPFVRRYIKTSNPGKTLLKNKQPRLTESPRHSSPADTFQTPAASPLGHWSPPTSPVLP